MDNRTIEEVRINESKLIKEIIALEQQLKKKDEVIERAIQFIQNNGEKQYNYHDNYRGKWYSLDELDTILQILEDEGV